MHIITAVQMLGINILFLTNITHYLTNDCCYSGRSDLKGDKRRKLSMHGSLDENNVVNIIGPK